MITRRRLLVVVGGGLVLAGCAKASPSSSTPGIVVESPWVRTTDGATDTTMTAAYMTLVNPGSVDVSLVGATTPAAGVCQVHEMVKDASGKMVMQEAKGGVVIPHGSHTHLTPGSYHLMMMSLTTLLPVGDEVAFQLKFSDGTTVAVTAPVKVYTEEEDHYHASASASPSAMPMASGSMSVPMASGSMSMGS